ncbi:uncharacterized protein BJ212DRAFT_1484152 [Suillus subaureus]|uniref:Methyltransferase n=1 Tax=Suillus subaureus TaxID=48587 RepID=A0A9P7E4T8_9AGAM|nr:uncharacterized protein BJ212DRAFT_1484152 [Suillus subaureus]KAG1810574.1 hypothetical protein BJ212DRAFT_1484152 [Suillus subaureus]
MAKPGRNWTQEPHDIHLEDYGREAAKHISFLNDDEIEHGYYPESIDFIKRVTGATSIVIFDHHIRRHRPGEAHDNPQKLQPISLVHVDQTTASSIARVHRHLPSTEALSLLRRRFQIVNLWRPIPHAAVDRPIAPCDFRSVDLKYMKAMTPEDFDSIQDGSVARLTPHTGFQDPKTPEGTPLRESVEVRALVFYD